MRGRELFSFRLPFLSYFMALCVGFLFLSLGWIMINPPTSITSSYVNKPSYFHMMIKISGLSLIIFSLFILVFFFYSLFNNKTYKFYENGIYKNTLIKRFIKRKSIVDVIYINFTVKFIITSANTKIIIISYLGEDRCLRKIQIPASQANMPVFEAVKIIRAYAGLAPVNDQGGVK